MALRYSGMHRHDRQGKCIDQPSEYEPFELRVNNQIIMIPRCPYQEVEAWAWNVLDFAEDAEKGHWPLAGGLLDQSASFLAAARFIRSEIDYWKAKALGNG